MTEDIVRMKLYPYIQTFKNVVQMPFLEAVRDEALSELSWLEEELTACRVGLFVHDPGGYLVNLLEDQYLYASNHESAFLSMNHLSVLPQISDHLSDYDQNSQDTYIDIAVYVISNEDDIKDAILDIEYMRQTEILPLMMFLFDTDGRADIEKCRQHIASYFASIGHEASEKDEICYLTYSSSKSIQAQKMMNNLQMAESNFLSVKQKLQIMARSGLKKRLYTRSLNPFLALVTMCKKTLAAQISTCREEIGRLQMKAQNINAIPVELQDPTIRQKIVEACRITPWSIILDAKLDSTVMVKNMVTGIIRRRIQTEFEPWANSMIADALGIVESSYDSCFKQVSQDLYWMEEEDKVRFRDMAASLQMDQKEFPFPEFTMRYDDFEPVIESMESAEVNRIATDAALKSLFRYNNELHSEVSKWLKVREDRYTSKIKELLNMLNGTIQSAAGKQHLQIYTISTSVSYSSVEKMLCDVNGLKDL